MFNRGSTSSPQMLRIIILSSFHKWKNVQTRSCLPHLAEGSKAPRADSLPPRCLPLSDGWQTARSDIWYGYLDMDMDMVVMDIHGSFCLFCLPLSDGRQTARSEWYIIYMMTWIGLLWIWMDPFASPSCRATTSSDILTCSISWIQLTIDMANTIAISCSTMVMDMI